MDVRELMTFFIGMNPSLDTCIDVDDGISRSYIDAQRVRVVNNVGQPFVALDTDVEQI